MDDLTGRCLGPYDLGLTIGGGGMGKVFRAWHRDLERALAVKFVASDIASHPDALRRFDMERRALGKLQHRHIVNAVDAGSVGGLLYLVTELVEGEDFARLVERRGPLPVREACELARQAALGLAHSHAAGLVHRDVKPSNLIVDRSGTVKILDFGLVQTSQALPGPTQAGAALGTWDFMAPEQAHDARQVDHRCDLYSLGCTLLYLLSGRVPFGDGQYSSPAAKVKGHLFDTPPWLNSPPADVPTKLIAVLRTLLEKSPEHRFTTAQATADALAPFAAEEAGSMQPPGVTIPTTRRQLAMFSAAGACLIALAGGRTFFSPAAQAPSDQADAQVVVPATITAQSATWTAPTALSHDNGPVTGAAQPSKSAAPPRYAIGAANATSRKAKASEPPEDSSPRSGAQP